MFSKPLKVRLAILSTFLLCLVNMFYGALAGTTQRLTIAVVPMATTDEYWKAIHAGAMKAAKEYDVDILWKGPLRLDDRNSQVDIVENMIVRQVAAIVALVAVDIALLLQSGINPVLACLGGVLAGIACGAFNGVLTTKLKVVPFIITLGTLLLFRGVAKGFANEQKVDAPLTWLIELLAVLPPERQWMIFPPGVWIMIVLAIVVFILLR